MDGHDWTDWDSADWSPDDADGDPTDLSDGGGPGPYGGYEPPVEEDPSGDGVESVDPDVVEEGVDDPGGYATAEAYAEDQPIDEGFGAGSGSGGGEAVPDDQPVDEGFGGPDPDPEVQPDPEPEAEAAVGADPDVDPEAADDAWADSPFPPELDLGGGTPEPVDGPPWSDPQVLGEAGDDDGELVADDQARRFDTDTPTPDELFQYAGQDAPPGGGDGWAALAASADPATSALARFWGPGGR